MAEDAAGKKSMVVTLAKLFLAEFLGTGMLLFIGCMGCAFDIAAMFPGFSPALTFGLAVMICVQVFMHISGCHINPVITLAVMIFGAMKPMVGAVYIAAQLMGATFGFGLLKLLLTEHFTLARIPLPNGNFTTVPLCLNHPNRHISTLQAMGIEAVTTAILILLLCAIVDRRNHKNSDSIPLRFGLAITGLASGSAQFSGGSMNPARSFAPALLHGIWDHQWIYWLGPILGAVGAAYFYKFIYHLPEEKATIEETHRLEEVADNQDNSAKA